MTCEHTKSGCNYPEGECSGACTSTDCELLELAARAAGGLVRWEDCVPWYIGNEPGVEYEWNPLTNDGDALRLVVKLGIAVEHFYSGPIEKPEWMFSRARRFQAEASCGRPGDIDPYAATRRAIVRAAAEIGRNMK